MTQIKERRATKALRSQPGLCVGDCVPFYFCPRSVMLYVIYKRNLAGLTYRRGQEPIVHLEADLHDAVRWADKKDRRWAFTTSNAGSSYFEDWCALPELRRIDWSAVAARNWQGSKEEKQAEFLMEESFPWHLITRIGVYSEGMRQRAINVIAGSVHVPPVEEKSEWYY